MENASQTNILDKEGLLNRSLDYLKDGLIQSSVNHPQTGWNYILLYFNSRNTIYEW